MLVDLTRQELLWLKNQAARELNRKDESPSSIDYYTLYAKLNTAWAKTQ